LCASAGTRLCVRARARVRASRSVWRGREGRGRRRTGSAWVGAWGRTANRIAVRNDIRHHLRHVSADAAPIHINQLINPNRVSADSWPCSFFSSAPLTPHSHVCQREDQQAEGCAPPGRVRPRWASSQEGRHALPDERNLAGDAGEEAAGGLAHVRSQRGGLWKDFQQSALARATPQ
jgi:hypothetical protein